MSYAEIVHALDEGILSTGCIESAPFGESAARVIVFGDVRGEKLIGLLLCDLITGPVLGLVEQMPVTDGPESASVFVNDEVCASHMLSILCILDVSNELRVNNRHCCPVRWRRRRRLLC